MDLDQYDQSAMVDQLIHWSRINSGSLNLEGLSLMHDTLKEAFHELADEIHSIPLQPIKIIQLSGDQYQQPVGNLLWIRKRPKLKRRVLLSGHMDTVFEKTHPFQSTTLLTPNHLQGPGVCDMKGGLIVLLHALRAFEKTTTSKTLGWDVLINPDEEIGSLSSSHFYHPILKNYSAALAYEPALSEDGLFAKNRKGSGHFTLIAKGKAAHSGRSFKEGKNAILYLSKALEAMYQLNHEQEDVSINIAQIQGGKAFNIIPDQAVSKIEVRIKHSQNAQWVKEKFSDIIHQVKQSGYSLTLHGDFHRPVKRVNQATQKLFERIQWIGKKNGWIFNWKDTGGCCDGNNFSKENLAVIDTLGVRGGFIHSDQEFILLDSLVERAMLSTLLLSELAQV